MRSSVRLRCTILAPTVRATTPVIVALLLTLIASGASGTDDRHLVLNNCPHAGWTNDGHYFGTSEGWFSATALVGVDAEDVLELQPFTGYQAWDNDKGWAVSDLVGCAYGPQSPTGLRAYVRSLTPGISVRGPTQPLDWNKTNSQGPSRASLALVIVRSDGTEYVAARVGVFSQTNLVEAEVAARTFVYWSPDGKRLAWRVPDMHSDWNCQIGMCGDDGECRDHHPDQDKPSDTAGDNVYPIFDDEDGDTHGIAVFGSRQLMIVPTQGPRIRLVAPFQDYAHYLQPVIAALENVDLPIFDRDLAVRGVTKSVIYARSNVAQSVVVKIQGAIRGGADLAALDWRDDADVVIALGDSVIATDAKTLGDLFRQRYRPGDTGCGTDIVGWSKDGRYVTFLCQDGSPASTRPRIDRALVVDTREYASAEFSVSRTVRDLALSRASVRRKVLPQILLRPNRGLEVASRPQYEAFLRTNPMTGNPEARAPDGQRSLFVTSCLGETGILVTAKSGVFSPLCDVSPCPSGSRSVTVADAGFPRHCDGPDDSFNTILKIGASPESAERAGIINAPVKQLVATWDPNSRYVAAVVQENPRARKEYRASTWSLILPKASLPRVQVLAPTSLSTACIESMTRKLSVYGYPVSDTGRAMKPRTTTIIYSKPAFAADAGWMAKALNVTSDALTWETPFDVVVALGGCGDR